MRKLRRLTAMIFIDTNVFLYSAGREHLLREPCRQFLRGVVNGKVEATTSSEVVQEILYVLDRRGLRDKGLELAGHILGIFPNLLPVTKADMDSAASVLRTQASLSVRDAVHLGTMRNNNIHRIISADRHFDGIDWLERIDPGSHCQEPTH